MDYSLTLARKRVKRDMPAVSGVLGLSILLVLTLVILATLLTPVGEDLDYHFTDENGLITAMSAFFLAMASAFCWVRVGLFEMESGLRRYAWTILGSGLAFLAIDEVFMIHEQIGWFLGDHFSSGPFRNWNDIVVIVYGIAAIALFAPVASMLAAIPRMPILMIAAFMAYTTHTAIDSLVVNATVGSRIVEESFKLLCAMLLASSMFEGLRDVSKRRT